MEHTQLIISHRWIRKSFHFCLFYTSEILNNSIRAHSLSQKHQVVMSNLVFIWKSLKVCKTFPMNDFPFQHMFKLSRMRKGLKPGSSVGMEGKWSENFHVFTRMNKIWIHIFHCIFVLLNLIFLAYNTLRHAKFLRRSCVVCLFY